MTKPVLFNFSSPAVARLPELYEIWRQAEYLHDDIIALGDDLPRVLCGRVQQEATARIAEARELLWRCRDVIRQGAQQVAVDREAGV
ncbi:MAG: hypothetical protein EPN21_05085 [Methylococcaceae bacterium]|nr:MAG: hypothetical protein EPN21_05085 [Methylococcaceae bacterium]